VRVALASIEWLPPGFTELELLTAALEEQGVSVAVEPWDAQRVDWQAFDLVVVRATWDYTWRYEEFLAWADSVGERLHNQPALVRWNADKRYMGDLAEAGIPVVATTYVEPGDPLPELDGEVVVKPAISAGARDTGRFGPSAHQAARALLHTMATQGRTALVQPYLSAVDTAGETAIVLVDGRPSHALRKHAVLAADEVAPTRDDPLGGAEAMYDPELVKADRASDEELALAADVVAEIGRRFGEVPLYARVDVVQGPAGSPVLLELEAVEPNLYHEQAPHSAGVLADAIVRRVGTP
jgi:hypothetical protein